MNDLTIGLLSALLATNQPQAVSNLVQQQTGFSVPLTNPNDPEEQELHQLMIADDVALDEIHAWVGTNQIPRTDTNALAQLQRKVTARLDGVKQDYDTFLRNHPQSARGFLAYGSFLDDIGDEWAPRRNMRIPGSWTQKIRRYGTSSPITTGKTGA